MNNPTTFERSDSKPRRRGHFDAESGRQAARDLARWYRTHRRRLPWRASRDPYRILVSEIMLQQTTVETVIPYYLRFIDAFPDVASLASASEREVLRLWSGLGYYRRATNLKAAARRIVAEHRGRVPDEIEALRLLPGIGRYTAAAVLAIAYGRAEVALDANLRRVLARWIACRGDPRSRDGEERLSAAGKAIVASGDPSVLNQALMDLGSGICTPRAPRCEACPLGGGCAARALGIAEEIPPRVRKEDPVAIALVAGVIRRNGRVLLRRRAADPMRGLWEFPMTEVSDGSLPGDDLAVSLLSSEGVALSGMRSAGMIRHSITRHRLSVHVFDAHGAFVSVPGPRDLAASESRPAWETREPDWSRREKERGASAAGARPRTTDRARGRTIERQAREVAGDRGRSPASRIAGTGVRSATRWFRESEIRSLPLTGISRKIVERIGFASRISGNRATYRQATEGSPSF